MFDIICHHHADIPIKRKCMALQAASLAYFFVLISNYITVIDTLIIETAPRSTELMATVLRDLPKSKSTLCM